MSADSTNAADRGLFAAILIGALLIGVPLGAWTGWDSWIRPVARMKDQFELKTASRCAEPDCVRIPSIGESEGVASRTKHWNVPPRIIFLQLTK
jgi:hypothetical protein